MVAKRDGDPEAPPEVISYYEQFPEESRLMSGPFRLEFERTKEIVSRVLPKPPSVVVDVGGAAGTYSSWLSALGYEVHLVDASPRLVEEARRRSATLAKPPCLWRCPAVAAGRWVRECRVAHGASVPPAGRR